MLDMLAFIFMPCTQQTFEGKHFAFQGWAVETLDINHCLILHMGDFLHG